MEQHKVLLIIISVAVVLAAVVGVGLWLFYPRSADEAVLAESGTPESGGYEWQPLDYLQGTGDIPGLDEGEAEPEDSGEFEVTYGVIPGTEPPAATEFPTVGETPPETTTATGDPMRESPETPDRVVAEPHDAVESTVAGVETGTRTPSTGTQTPAVATLPSTPSAAAVTHDLADQAYWVQAISSPNRDTVEQSQRTLREHQLGSRILTKVIDGQTYYRLRVGPFAVRAEAEKFLGWVQDINDFADAMIFVDYTTPVLAAQAE